MSFWCCDKNIFGTNDKVGSLRWVCLAKFSITIVAQWSAYRKYTNTIIILWHKNWHEVTRAGIMNLFF